MPIDRANLIAAALGVIFSIFIAAILSHYEIAINAPFSHHLKPPKAVWVNPCPKGSDIFCRGSWEYGEYHVTVLDISYETPPEEDINEKVWIWQDKDSNN